jgi:hypothetical protein
MERVGRRQRLAEQNRPSISTPTATDSFHKTLTLCSPEIRPAAPEVAKLAERWRRRALSRNLTLTDDVYRAERRRDKKKEPHKAAPKFICRKRDKDQDEGSDSNQ